MAKIKKAVFALPSLVTLSSVFCAFLSMAFSFQAQGTAVIDDKMTLLMYAGISIICSIVFDTFDGKVARATHTSTKFGMELDSLADAVSFGVAPAILVYGFALIHAGWLGIAAAFIFAACSILRLSRFNVEAPPEGVQTFFKGMPAPGGAACVAAIVMAAIHNHVYLETPFELNTLAITVIAIGILMVSTAKFKTFKGKKTKGDIIFVVLGLLGFGALCFITHPATAFFCLAIYYLAYGLLYTLIWNLKHMKPHFHRRRSKKSASLTDMPKVPQSTLHVEKEASGNYKINRTPSGDFPKVGRTSIPKEAPADTSSAEKPLEETEVSTETPKTEE